MAQRYPWQQAVKGHFDRSLAHGYLNDTALWGNPLAEWLQALGYILGSLVMARVVYTLFKRVLKRWATRTSTKWDDVVVDQIEEPIAMGIVILGFWLGYAHLHFGEGGRFHGARLPVAHRRGRHLDGGRLLDSVVSTVLLPLSALRQFDGVAIRPHPAENVAFVGVDAGHHLG